MMNREKIRPRVLRCCRVTRIWRYSVTTHAFLGLVFSLVCHSSIARAQEVTVGQIVSPTQSPMWVAREAGYFEKYGLTPKFVVFKSGTLAFQTMIAKDVDILTVGSVEVINANLKGASLAIIARNVGIFPYTLYVGKNIREAKDLKGAKLAITGFGGPSEFITRYAVEKLGLDAQRDVTLIQVGSQPLGALVSGAVDAGMIQPPETLKAQALGFKPLLNLAESGLKFPFNNITTSREFIQSRREVVLRFLRAHLAGLSRFHEDKKYSLQVMKKYLRTEDDAMLNETYDFWSKIFPRKQPYMEKDGIETYLKMIGQTGVKPESFFDNSLLQEIDR